MREEADVALVRIFECTLETTPQKILQIAIILQDLEITELQIVALILYFGSMAWCIVFYNRYNRFLQKDKEQMTATAVFLQFLFNFCLLGKYCLYPHIEPKRSASSWPYPIHCHCSQHFLFRNLNCMPTARFCLWTCHLLHR